MPKYKVEFEIEPIIINLPDDWTEDDGKLEEWMDNWLVTNSDEIINAITDWDVKSKVKN